MNPPRYLEPSTDVPAAEDWSTRMGIAESRWAARAMGITAAVSASFAVAAGALAEPTAGTVAAVVQLGLLALFCALGPLWYHVEVRPLRRGLLDAPWRRCPATVAVTEETEIFDRVVVFDGPRTIVLRGLLGPDVPDIVLHRQKLFLCGPDADGRVALRVAGLSRTFPARVIQREWRPKERDAAVAVRPLDDPVVARAFRTFRYGRHAWLGSAGLGALGAVVVVMSCFPVAPFGLAVGGLTLIGALVLLPGLIQISALYRQAVAAVCDAVTWTPVPVTLFPWDPGREVAGLAQLPGGTALVQFPVPNVDVVANIADTEPCGSAASHGRSSRWDCPGCRCWASGWWRRPGANRTTRGNRSLTGRRFPRCARSPRCNDNQTSNPARRLRRRSRVGTTSTG